MISSGASKMISGTHFSCDLPPARALNSNAADDLFAATASVVERVMMCDLMPRYFFNSSYTSLTKCVSACEKLKLITLLLGRFLLVVTQPSAQYRPSNLATSAF